ncbi:MAG: response regulator [Kofleriaceae bacterium]|nr:response regulator [Kofleriaceae bacterium]
MAEVLIVDDDLDIADVTAEVLALDGHVVRVARNGEEGLAEVTKRFPDLIVLDVEMPVLTGPEMATRMLVIDCGREKIPIVLSSGVRELPGVANKVGTPYFIAKPFNVSSLRTLVTRAANERTPPRPRL